VIPPLFSLFPYDRDIIALLKPAFSVPNVESKGESPEKKSELEQSVILIGDLHSVVPQESRQGASQDYVKRDADFLEHVVIMEVEQNMCGRVHEPEFLEDRDEFDGNAKEKQWNSNHHSVEEEFRLRR
jgi:hypothetical protein